MRHNKITGKNIIRNAVFLSLIYIFITALMPLAFAEYTSISLNIYPKEVYSESFVNIYGYVEPVEGRQYVHIYVDNNYIGLVAADRDGYYSKNMRMIDTGLHKITVRANNVEKTGYVRVIPTPPFIIETSADCIICETTIIYKDVEEKKHKYVTVDVSANEVDVNRYEGNIVTVKVTNNLGESKIFSIGTDFDYDMIFLPHEEVIRDGQSKLFHIYFNPKDMEGRYYGNIYVKQDNDIIRDIPLTLFVAKNARYDTNENGILAVSSETLGILLLAIVFSAIIIIALMKNIRTQPRPLGLDHIRTTMRKQQSDLRREILRGSGPEKTERFNARYFTTWNNVKI